MKPMHRVSTYDDLEAFAARLEGPMGVLLRRAGEIMALRLRERGQTWDDLGDGEVANLFASAVLQAAPEAYPEAEPRVIDEVIGRMVTQISIELNATAYGNDTVN